jgi:hypothetical protein
MVNFYQMFCIGNFFHQFLLRLLVYIAFTDFNYFTMIKKKKIDGFTPVRRAKYTRVNFTDFMAVNLVKSENFQTLLVNTCRVLSHLSISSLKTPVSLFAGTHYFKQMMSRLEPEFRRLQGHKFIKLFLVVI